MKKSIKIIIITIITIIILITTGMFYYINDYYHAENIEKYIKTSETVKVDIIKEGYFFDGPGTENALVFYQGAKVDETAYSPILYKLAENGIDCFLAKMPGNLAVLGINNADKIINKYTYKNWYIGGHSLGGAMASNYAANNQDKLQGIILLAAYANKDLSKTNMKVLSIYGSEDLVLNKEKYEDAKKLLPDMYREKIIEGGNHAWFGSYGKQKGDGEAKISHEEQWDITVEEILNLYYK